LSAALRIRINIDNEREATMSNQDLDYAVIRRNVEKRLQSQKWMYRILFFVMHMLFFTATMIAIWGTVATDSQLRDILFNNESSASLIVILPTILWAAVILFHLASLYFESSAGEKAFRQQLLMREVGEDILRQGHDDEGMLEKPKHRAAGLEAKHVLSSYDGELMPVDDDERIEQSDYNTRTNHAGDKRRF
jgi:hypothetical protein